MMVIVGLHQWFRNFPQEQELFSELIAQAHLKKVEKRKIYS